MSTSYTWGSAPVLTFTVSDSITRASSTSTSYSGYLTVTLGGCSGGSYFGYYITCTVNGESVTLKGNSPSTWSAGTYSHSYYISGTSTASSITITGTLGTNAERGGATFTYTASIGAYSSGESSSGGSSSGGSSSTTTSASVPTLSKSSCKLGESVVIYTNRKSSYYTHTVTYLVGGSSGTIATSVGASVTWTPSTSLLSTVGSGASCTITVTTKRSSVTIGSNTVRLTLYPPSDAAPSVASGWITVARDNSAIPSVAAWVKGYSRAQITFDSSKVTAKYGASISRFSVEYGGESITASNGVATTKQLSDQTANVICKVTDSRGVSTAETVAIPVLDYAMPTITGVSIYRSDDALIATDDGVHIAAVATAGCTSLDGANSVSLTAAYKAVDAAEYGGETELESGVAALVTGEDDISTMQSYAVRLTATDSLGNTVSYEKTVPTKAVTFHLKNGGKGAAFGKYAETDELFDCQWAAKFANSVAIEDELTIGGKTPSDLIHEIVDPLLEGILTIDKVYPVGSIYLSVSDLSPETLFAGTTWQRLTGRFLLGSSDGLYNVNATGGEAQVTLTTSEMPSHSHTGYTSTDGYHSHSFPGRSANGDYGPSAESFASSDDARTLEVSYGGYHDHTVTISSAGGGASHNNMPPYLVVHMWKRTA